MNTWECEECGATAASKPRKEAIENACDQRCKWTHTPVDQQDNDEDEE